MNILFGTNSHKLRGYTPAEDFNLETVDATELIGSVSASYQPVNDTIQLVGSSAGSVVKRNVIAPVVMGEAAPVFSSDTPTVCSIDQNGIVTRVSNGVCRIRVKSKTGTRLTSFQVYQSGGATNYYEISGYAEGSLRKYLYDQQIAALAGVTPGAAKQRACLYGNGIAAGLSEYVEMSGSYGGVNPNNFLFDTKAGFDGLPADLLAEVLAGEAGSAQWRAWISPHHFLTWKGHSIGPGTGYVIVGSETIVQYSATPWAGTLAKILPSNYQSYMPAPPNYAATGWGIAVWGRFFHTYIGGGTEIAERRWVQPANLFGGEGMPFTPSDPRYVYQKQSTSLNKFINPGDSGSPVFCGIHGDLVMISHCAQQGNVGLYGSNELALSKTQIDAAMNTLATLNGDPAAGTYSVGVVDLSGFTTY